MNLGIAALLLRLMVIRASANSTHLTANNTTQSPTTKRVQATDDNKSYVVNLRRESFNESVVNASHFVMFYDST